MEILLSLNPIHFPNFRVSPTPNFKSFSPKPSFFFPTCFNRKQNHPFLCSISHTYPPNSSKYSGWDDLELSQHPNPSGNLDRFRRFLIALGIDDRKHVLLFFFGFLSALAVSRVRVASIVVFPATVLVFGIGFSIGVLIRSGDDDGILPKGIGGYLIKKLSKEESGFMFSGEKLRDLSDLLSNLAAKITDLKNMIQGGTRSNQIEMREIEIYLEIIESLRSALMPAKDLVDNSIDNQLSKSNGHMHLGSNVSKSNAMLVGDRALEKSTNLKATRRGRELGVDGFDFVRFLGGVFGDNSVGLKAYRAKGNSKPEFTEKLNSIEANNRILTSDTGLAYGFEDKTCLNGVSNNSVGSLPQEAVVKYKCDDDKAENSEAILEPFDKTSSEMFRRVGTAFEEEKILNRTTSIIEGKNFNHSREQKFNSDLLSYNEGTGNHNTTIQFTNNFENFRKTSDQCLSEAKTPQDVRHDLDGIDFNLRSQENGLNSLATESEGSCDRAYSPSRHNKNGKIMNRNATHGFDFKEGAVRLEDQPFLVNHQSKRVINVEETSSSSVISDDGEFNRYLKEGANLLRQARGFLRGHIDEEEAEIILYKSASLLSRAIAMKPTSLHAVGQLGNTFLLHGELKLKISHKLRTNLSKSDFLLDEKEPRVQLKRTNQVWSKDKLESVLIDVCEECEELLVEAGRKYRMALSINVKDVRALYNWGLALMFRAQLIADIGPEAAFDADKLYLAAIDKFDAMMSRSNAFVPEALFRWGVALQQRSRLRMRSREENKKLLLQAKRLFEDALHMNSHNLQIGGGIYIIQRTQILYTDMSCCFGELKSRRKDPSHTQQDIDGFFLTKNIKLFSYNELRSATNNFNASNKIGRGGFGTVYKGTLKNGIQVAVKTLSAVSKQGIHEFLTEIDMITNVRHPHLVELIGCCVQGSNRTLVYEYVENNSLDCALLGPKSKRIILDWDKRSAICMGTASGLAFLHEELEPHIVHRDIKASNILLNKNLVPKIGDFGLAKLFPDNITHISTRVAGTMGYLAPEYALRGQLTKKADVYSFGVLTLEIVSGRSSAKETCAEMETYLLEWAWKLYEEGKLQELVDPELENYPEEEVVRYMKVALFCTQAAANRRPSMTQVVAMLSKNILINENELMQPGIIQDLGGRKDLRATNSSSKSHKSSAFSTTQMLCSSSDIFTDVVPR